MGHAEHLSCHHAVCSSGSGSVPTDAYEAINIAEAGQVALIFYTELVITAANHDKTRQS
jgi:hypothetical protein